MGSIHIKAEHRFPGNQNIELGETVTDSDGICWEVVGNDGTNVKIIPVRCTFGKSTMTSEEVLSLPVSRVDKEQAKKLLNFQRIFLAGEETIQTTIYLQKFRGNSFRQVVLQSDEGDSFIFSSRTPFEPQLQVFVSQWGWGEIDWKTSMELGALLYRLYSGTVEGEWDARW